LSLSQRQPTPHESCEPILDAVAMAAPAAAGRSRRAVAAEQLREDCAICCAPHDAPSPVAARDAHGLVAALDACAHAFHRDCLADAIAHNAACPVPRALAGDRVCKRAAAFAPSHHFPSPPLPSPRATAAGERRLLVVLVAAAAAVGRHL
jgi:hypothetical protein